MPPLSRVGSREEPSYFGAELYLELLKQCLTAAIYPESANRVLSADRRRGLKPRIRSMIVRALARRGYIMQKVRPFDAVARNNGIDWPSIGYSMIGLQRMNNLQECVERVITNEVAGDLVEAGIWRGGAVILMLAVLRSRGVTDRIVWAADSFAGMPRPSLPQDEGYDLADNSYLAVSSDEVRANIARFGLLDEQRVRFLEGWFSDTLPDAPIEKIAVLRLDGDLYESTMDVLTALYERVQPGGYVIVDDYGDWEPCRRAVDEFRTNRRIEARIEPIDGSGVYWRVSRLSG